MNKAKKLFYAALGAATLFCVSSGEAYAKKEKGKLPNVFYFENREDLNGNGKYEFNEYSGIQKFGGVINPTKVNKENTLYLFVKNRKDKTVVVMNKQGGSKKKKILENLSLDDEEFIYQTINEGAGTYGIAISGKGGLKQGKIVRE